jgi:hypothetical protein
MIILHPLVDALGDKVGAYHCRRKRNWRRHKYTAPTFLLWHKLVFGVQVAPHIYCLSPNLQAKRPCGSLRSFDIMSDSTFVQNLTIETWILYSVGVLSIFLRLYASNSFLQSKISSGDLLMNVNTRIARCRQIGVRGLKTDDYVMINGLVWYTLLCVALNQIAHGGGSNLMSADDIAALTPESTKERIRGSKWVFVSEHSMLLTIWSMKACMIMLYTKLT